MNSPWIAGLVALFLWWFSTGAILVVLRHADRGGNTAHRRAVLFTAPLALFGVWGLATSFAMPSVPGAYLGFVAAIAVWGWLEHAFLAGVIAGPNRRPCPPGAPEWERFVRAWGTIAYSEMALTAVLIALVWAAWDAENTVGLWSFAVLYLARISAKLNVYLGVPNINTEFLPRPVRHLASHFRVAPMNRLFPVSVTALSLATGCWLERIWAQEAGSAGAVGFALLAALTALALVEHWLMVLPLPDAKLWRWMLPDPSPATARPDKRKVAGQRGRHGFRPSV
ncbi:MAG: putative photosynthetic complex assembly protein PuhE [Pseudomonadota bacterium]